ncbi:MAG: hypothetical protein ABIH66_07970, partial [bacterium]
MQKISLDDINLGEELILARPVILGSGVKGFNAGVEVNDRVVAMLKKLGFNDVWICTQEEAAQGVVAGGEEGEEITQQEKFNKIKDDIANSLADIITEKDPQRELLKIKNVSRGTVLMQKGALTKIVPDRPTWEVRDLKKFSESIISTAKLESFLSHCHDLLENEFSPRRIDSIRLNLNDMRTEESYIFHHMANCGLLFLATIAKYNADLKKKGAVSSKLRFAKDYKKRKEAL